MNKRIPTSGRRSSELVVDSFAGGGGTTCGLEAAGLPVDLAINHNPRALGMHRINHPDTQHLCEDVWSVDPKSVCAGRSVGLFWLSPDCTFHSRARGGKPFRDRRKTHRTRGLAWLAIHWAKQVAPRIIMLENVREFADWGPLDDDGSPDPMRKGFTFRRFVRMLQNLDYCVDWRMLRACDYGAPTSRERLFMVARRDHEPIIWPRPTHGPGLIPFRTAGDCIDWSIPCPSIFDRDRALVPATLRRVARGLRRHVIETSEPYLVEIGSESSPHSNRRLIGATLIQTSYGERRGQAPRVPGLHKPLGTIVAGGAKHALVIAFLTQYYGSQFDDRVRSDIDRVASNGMTRASRAEQVRAFLIAYYGSEQQGTLREPLPTVTTHDRFALVTVRGEPYLIEDIGLRLLTPRELFRAQGFPDSYIIDRALIDDERTGFEREVALTRTQQVHMCGNSVPPSLSQALATANLVGPADYLPRFASGNLF
jgi:DNA (cytosine-5)-methyltransferase 1